MFAMHGLMLVDFGSRRRGPAAQWHQHQKPVTPQFGCPVTSVMCAHVSTLGGDNRSLVIFAAHAHTLFQCRFFKHERRLLFAYMESSIRKYPGLSKTLYLACKTR